MSKVLDGISLLAIVQKEINGLSEFSLKKTTLYRKINTFLTVGLVVSGVIYTVQTANTTCDQSIMARVFAGLMMLFNAISEIMKIEQRQISYMQVHLKTEDVKGEIMMRMAEVDEYIKRVNESVKVGLNVPCIPANLTRKSVIAMVNGIFKEFKCLLLSQYTRGTYQRIIKAEELSEPLLLKHILERRDTNISLEVTEEVVVTPVAFPVSINGTVDLSEGWKYEYQ